VIHNEEDVDGRATITADMDRRCYV